MSLLQISGSLPTSGGGQVYRNDAGEELVNQVDDPLLRSSILITSLDKFLNWARRCSVWPMTFGLACCAIEMMAVGASKYDLDRFGSGPFRATPRQADLMIVAGTVSHKMGPRVKRLYDQMPEPKYVLAMGACTVGGGPYSKWGYHVVKGVDLILPVDVHVPGCPPRPEALLEGIFKIQEIARKKEHTLAGDRTREALKPKIYRPGDEQVGHFPAAVELPNIMERRKTEEQIAFEKPAPGARKPAHG
jgi:NADH-quinone oxidoreductase subunit B